MLTYPGAITLSERTLTFLADLLQAHRVRLHPWRKLLARDQALLVPAYLRNGDTYARLAAGFGIGVAAAYRYIRGAVALLDGTVVRTNCIRAHDQLYYASKHRYHGVNLQGLTDPHGRLVWISEGLPGSTHDLTAARYHNILPTVAAAELYL